MRGLGVAEKDPSARRHRHTREYGRKLALTVALDAGDADDLTASDRQGEVIESAHALSVGDAQAVDLNDFLRRRLLGLSDCAAGGFHDAERGRGGFVE